LKNFPVSLPFIPETSFEGGKNIEALALERVFFSLYGIMLQKKDLISV
jgi:hypothetical protein